MVNALPKGISFRLNVPGPRPQQAPGRNGGAVQIQVCARKRAVPLEFRFFLFEDFSPEINCLAANNQRLGLPLVENPQQVKVIGKASLGSGAGTHHWSRPP
jgi:hypothetical protein